SAAELRGLIDRTRFAISTEETRYYLNGIYLHATKSNEVPVVRAVATDGHRLARVEMTAPEGAAGMPGIIVPRKTVLELRKLVEEGEDEVQVALGETKIRCAIGEAALTSKLIDGTFPDYDRVIPVNNDKILDVECKEFADAVDRVSTISPERSSAVPCPRASPRKQCRGKRARKPLGFERVGGGDPPGFDRFSQLSLNPARSRRRAPRAACRAHGPERRRQNQSARSSLLSVARPRLASRPAWRDRPAALGHRTRQFRLGGRRDHRNRAGPCPHRHRA